MLKNISPRHLVWAYFIFIVDFICAVNIVWSESSPLWELKILILSVWFPVVMIVLIRLDDYDILDMNIRFHLCVVGLVLGLAIFVLAFYYNIAAARVNWGLFGMGLNLIVSGLIALQYQNECLAGHNMNITIGLKSMLWLYAISVINIALMVSLKPIPVDLVLMIFGSLSPILITLILNDQDQSDNNEAFVFYCGFILLAGAFFGLFVLSTGSIDYGLLVYVGNVIVAAFTIRLLPQQPKST